MRKKKKKQFLLVWGMKVVFLSLVFLILVGSAYLAMLCLNREGRVKWKVYENSRYSFRVKYPADWKLGEPPFNNDGREFVSPDGKINCRAYGFFNALQGASGESQTLDEHISWLEEMGLEILNDEGQVSLGDWPARRFVGIQEGKIQEMVMALGKESGRVLVCYFDSKEERDKFKPAFDKMMESFKINTSLDSEGRVETGQENCSNYLNNLLAPVSDLVTFEDTTYTEVTITDRKSWDKSRLPARVIELEKTGYFCSPGPVEFGEGGETSGVNAQREVTKVEWNCEASYEDFSYFAGKLENEKNSLEAKGYTCQKKDCLDEAGLLGFVWFCFK